MNQFKQSSKNRLYVFDNIEEKLMNIAESSFIFDIIVGGLMTFIGIILILDNYSSLWFYIGLSIMVSSVTTFPLFGLGVLIKTQKDIYCTMATYNSDDITQANIVLNKSHDENLPEL